MASIMDTITAQTRVAVRQRALELALENINSGSWTNILHVAQRFETYMASGTVAEPDEDKA